MIILFDQSVSSVRRGFWRKGVNCNELPSRVVRQPSRNEKDGLSRNN